MVRKGIEMDSEQVLNIIKLFIDSSSRYMVYVEQTYVLLLR